MGGRYEYLPYVIPVILVEYIIFSYVVYWLYRQRLTREETRSLMEVEVGLTSVLNGGSSTRKYANTLCCHSRLLTFVFECNFERTFTSTINFANGKFRYLSPSHPLVREGGNIILLVYRIIAFGFFVGVSTTWNFIRAHGNDYYYFTTWNAMLISLYYLMAIVASVIGIHNNFQRNRNGILQGNSLPNLNGNADPRGVATEWSRSVLVLGYCVHVLFEIAGATAFFVTTVAFTFLNPHFEFWNLSVHFITSMSFLVEMSMNTMHIDPMHIFFQISWPLMYVIFIWPIVKTGVVHDWPYSFLQTNSPMCFVWYSGLFIADTIFFSIWYFMFRLKAHIFPFVDVLREKDDSTITGSMVTSPYSNSGML